MKTPIVSVLLSVSKPEPALFSAALESILKQTFQKFELLLIDDGNVPADKEYLRSLANTDTRIRLIENPKNLGLTLSLIRGAQEAKGDWIARQDADDLSFPTRLEKQLTYVKEHPECVLVGSWFEEIDLDGSRRIVQSPLEGKEIRQDLYLRNPFCHSSVLFSKKAYDQVGGYSSTLSTAQDLDLWFRLIRVGDVHVLPEVLVSRTKQANSISQSRKKWQQVKNGFLIRSQNAILDRSPLAYVRSLIATTYHGMLTLNPDLSVGKRAKGWNTDALLSHMQMSNGTFKTTEKGRLTELDALVLPFLREKNNTLHILDVGASSGTTSYELLKALETVGKRVELTVSDLFLFGQERKLIPLVHVLEEKNGRPLAFRLGPVYFVSHISKRDWITGGAVAKLFFAGVAKSQASKYSPRSVPLVSFGLIGRETVHLEERDLFSAHSDSAVSYDFIRAANVLNLSYFPKEKIKKGFKNLLDSLQEGGLLLIARTVKDHQHAATLFQKEAGRWKIKARLGRGWEGEALLG